MQRWWDSIPAVRRVARISTMVAVVGVGTGMLTGTTNLFVAVPAFVVGTAGIASAMFAWFRAEHLQELQRLGQ